LKDQTKFPDWPFCATKVEICGTKGFMYYGRHGGGWQVFEGDQRTRRSEAVLSEPAVYKFGSIIDLHFEDFINCIHTRKRPKADVEQAHLSMVLCHLANISYRVGNRKLEVKNSKKKIAAHFQPRNESMEKNVHISVNPKLVERLTSKLSEGVANTELAAQIASMPHDRLFEINENQAPT